MNTLPELLNRISDLDTIDSIINDSIFTIAVEMPGVTKEDLNITIESKNNYYYLKVNGTRKNLNGKTLSYDKLYKLFFKPKNVDAKLENGLLLIELEQSDADVIKVNIL